MTLRLITAPAGEPISTADAKAHLRVTSSSDDTYIDALVSGARVLAEQQLGRALISQTWELVLDGWPMDGSPVAIPLGGVTAATFAKYYDASNVQQTWSSSLYEVALSDYLSTLGPVYGQAYPATYPRWDAVQLRFVAGWANAAAVPKAVVQWMLLQVGHWYEHREAASDFQVYATPFAAGLLDPYRCPQVA